MPLLLSMWPKRATLGTWAILGQPSRQWRCLLTCTGGLCGAVGGCQHSLRGADASTVAHMLHPGCVKLIPNTTRRALHIVATCSNHSHCPTILIVKQHNAPPALTSQLGDLDSCVPPAKTCTQHHTATWQSACEAPPCVTGNV
jgi:hypothetical protein